MKKSVRRAAVLCVGIAGLVSSAVALAADSAAKAPAAAAASATAKPPAPPAPSAAAKPPAAAQYYPLVGYWKGPAQLSAPGQAPAKLLVSFGCSKVAGGWAVRCEMSAKNDKLMIAESDLLGVDAITGVGHLYSVSSKGEARDYVTEWPEEDTMKAHTKWTQGGKQMAEEISFVFHGQRSIEFRKVTTTDGKKTGEFFGKLMH